jgi:RNA polymerase sigma factor (sigma-70 family)
VRGADEAYTRLFDAEYPHVRRTIHVLLGNAAAAEDITQDAFVQALLHWSKVSRYDRPDAWVRRVAIRLAVRHLKRERRRHVVESGADTVQEGAAAGSSADPDLAAAIRDLPPKQRAVLVLFYFEDRPMKEIAQLLGISESTGFVHLHRARTRLGNLLGEGVTNGARP